MNMTRTKVFISARLRGDCIDSNIAKGVLYARNAYKNGYEPLVPIIYFPRFMSAGNDVEDSDGMQFCRNWIDLSDEVWVMDVNGISSGMAEEIEYANSIGKSIKYFSKNEIPIVV